MPLTLPDLLCRLAAIALRAGHEIMTIYGSNVTAREKADLSPVTEADEAAERLILRDLAASIPTSPLSPKKPHRQAHSENRRPLLSCRSSRRHQGIPHAQWRVHRQYRLSSAMAIRSPASSMRRPRARFLSARSGAAHGRQQSSGEAAADRARLGPDPHAMRLLHAEPVVVASRSHMDAKDRSLAEGTRPPQPQECRLVAQILPSRQGRGRFLPAFRPHDGMGYGRRPCRPRRRGRRRSRRDWRTSRPTARHPPAMPIPASLPARRLGPPIGNCLTLSKPPVW